MPQRTAAIESLPMAFEVVKAMQADGLEWGEGYRPLGQQALTEIIHRAGWPRRSTTGSTVSMTVPCATDATAAIRASC